MRAPRQNTYLRVLSLVSWFFYCIFWVLSPLEYSEKVVTQEINVMCGVSFFTLYYFLLLAWDSLPTVASHYSLHSTIESLYFCFTFYLGYAFEDDDDDDDEEFNVNFLFLLLLCFFYYEDHSSDVGDIVKFCQHFIFFIFLMVPINFKNL